MTYKISVWYAPPPCHPPVWVVTLDHHVPGSKFTFETLSSHDDEALAVDAGKVEAKRRGMELKVWPKKETKP